MIRTEVALEYNEVKRTTRDEAVKVVEIVNRNGEVRKTWQINLNEQVSLRQHRA